MVEPITEADLGLTRSPGLFMDWSNVPQAFDQRTGDGVTFSCGFERLPVEKRPKPGLATVAIILIVVFSLLLVVVISIASYIYYQKKVNKSNSPKARLARGLKAAENASKLRTTQQMDLVNTLTQIATNKEIM